jgi:hypothetical protein
MADIFCPVGAPTTHSATTTASSATVPARPSILRVYNSGTTVAFITWGMAASITTATIANGVALAPGSVELFEVGLADTVSAIMGTGTASLYYVKGSGG